MKTKERKKERKRKHMSNIQNLDLKGLGQIKIAEIDLCKQYRIVYLDGSPKSEWFNCLNDVLKELNKMINDDLSLWKDDEIRSYDYLRHNLEFKIEERMQICQDITEKHLTQLKKHFVLKNEHSKNKPSNCIDNNHNHTSIPTSACVSHKYPTTVNKSGGVTFHIGDYDYYAGPISPNENPPYGYSSWDDYAEAQLSRAMGGC